MRRDRLRSAMQAYGPLCVGIDPHPALLEAWGLENTAEGVRSFSLTVVEAMAGAAAFAPASWFRDAAPQVPATPPAGSPPPQP